MDATTNTVYVGDEGENSLSVLQYPTFADVVDPSYAFYNYVQWMASARVATGTAQPSGKPFYKPADPVSRSAMAAFVYRVAHLIR